MVLGTSELQAAILAGEGYTKSCSGHLANLMGLKAVPCVLALRSSEAYPLPPLSHQEVP